MAIVVSLPAFSADKIDSKIRFNDFYGEVKIRPNAEEDDSYEFVDLDTVIYEDDRIKTEEESGAILGLEDMSTYVIKPETTLIIHTEENNTSKIEMLAGCIWTNVKKMSEGKSINIEMSQCVAGISGSTGRFEEKGGINIITCTKGSLEIYDLLKQEVHQIKEGQQATVDGKGIQIIDIVIENVQQELKDALDKSNDKQSVNDLIKQLKGQTKQINVGKKLLDAGIELIKRVLNMKNQTLEMLKPYGESIQKNLKEGKRLVSLFVEIDSTINTLSKKIAGKDVSADEKAEANTAIQNAKTAINNFGQSLDSLIENAAKLEARLESIDTTSSTAQQKEKADEIDTAITSIEDEADNIINPLKDNSSYKEFKDAIPGLEALLNDLKKLNENISVDNVGSDNLSKLITDYERVNKKIEKAIKDFSSIPEIKQSLITSMNEIDDNILRYSSSIRSFINEYKYISDSSSVVKSKYVTDVTRALSNYDRMKREYTKASRMYDETVKNFRRASNKTSEFTEMQTYWDRIDQAMRDLDNEASELSSILEEVKTGLESAIGK